MREAEGDRVTKIDEHCAKNMHMIAMVIQYASDGLTVI